MKCFHWFNHVKYKWIGREARNYSQFIILLLPIRLILSLMLSWQQNIYDCFHEVSLNFSFFFFFHFCWLRILGPNSSVKLDKILINRRQDLIWIAYDLTAGSGIKSRSLASFPRLRPLCDCFQLKGTALPKIDSSDGCMSYGTMIHRPLQTLTPLHPPRLRCAAFRVIAALRWEKQTKIPSEESKLIWSPFRILHQSSSPVARRRLIVQTWILCLLQCCSPPLQSWRWPLRDLPIVVNWEKNFHHASCQALPPRFPRGIQSCE